MLPFHQQGDNKARQDPPNTVIRQQTRQNLKKAPQPQDHAKSKQQQNRLLGTVGSKNNCGGWVGCGVLIDLLVTTLYPRFKGCKNTNNHSIRLEAS